MRSPEYPKVLSIEEEAQKKYADIIIRITNQFQGLCTLTKMKNPPHEGNHNFFEPVSLNPSDRLTNDQVDEIIRAIQIEFRKDTQLAHLVVGRIRINSEGGFIDIPLDDPDARSIIRISEQPIREPGEN